MTKWILSPLTLALAIAPGKSPLQTNISRSSSKPKTILAMLVPLSLHRPSMLSEYTMTMRERLPQPHRFLLVPVILSSYPFFCDDAKENKPQRLLTARKGMSTHRPVLTMRI